MNRDLYSAIYAMLAAFVINVILCPAVIPMLVRLKFGQSEREDGMETHLVKAGTPTMGGIMIVISFLIVSVLFLKDNPDGVMVIFVTAGYGIIGFIDDYIKVVRKRSLGLRAYQKVIGQLIITGIFIYYIYFKSNIGTAVYVPFGEGLSVDLGIFYIPFFFFVMVGTVNSVNLTDGLDGLASGVTVLVTLFFLFAGLARGSGIVPIAGAAVGALMAFLLFNAYPARVFMGDTGSLALGGLVASMAVILKMPLFLVIVGFVYVMEALSVIMQVGYFKISGGKRIFKMAPIHHHFEKCGWSETKVVTLFYVITSLSCAIGFIADKNVF